MTHTQRVVNFRNGQQRDAQKFLRRLARRRNKPVQKNAFRLSRRTTDRIERNERNNAVLNAMFKPARRNLIERPQAVSVPVTIVPPSFVRRVVNRLGSLLAAFRSPKPAPAFLRGVTQ